MDLAFVCGRGRSRLFVYAAAFPFFNNVDERAHVDLVFKYAERRSSRMDFRHFRAHGRSLSLALRFAGIFHGYERRPRKGFRQTILTLPREQIDEIAPTIESQLQERINHEASDPPLYYAITGVWLRCGKVVRLTGGYLLYWIRFLNVPVAVAMVWIAYLAARLIFPENPSLRFAVPILTAFFPQDNLYSVQSDAWSALWFGLAFVGFLKLQSNRQLNIRWAALTGLTLSAACLTKVVVNLPLLAVIGAVVLSANVATFPRRKNRHGVAGSVDSGRLHHAARLRLDDMELSRVWRRQRHGGENRISRLDSKTD